MIFIDFIMYCYYKMTESLGFPALARRNSLSFSSVVITLNTYTILALLSNSIFDYPLQLLIKENAWILIIATLSTGYLLEIRYFKKKQNNLATIETYLKEKSLNRIWFTATIGIIIIIISIGMTILINQ